MEGLRGDQRPPAQGSAPARQAACEARSKRWQPAHNPASRPLWSPRAARQPRDGGIRSHGRGVVHRAGGEPGSESCCLRPAGTSRFNPPPGQPQPGPELASAPLLQRRCFCARASTPQLQGKSFRATPSFNATVSAPQLQHHCFCARASTPLFLSQSFSAPSSALLLQRLSAVLIQWPSVVLLQWPSVVLFQRHPS